MKKYLGTAYIGVVGPENEIGECRDSIHNIVRRSGDTIPIFARATKGYEARQWHLNNFYIQTTHDWVLLLDHDMVFQPDTLERLRSHEVPLVSGFYMRRQYNPIAPVWFEPNPKKEWPYMPWLADPERGRLHELGASGWGCMLVHRDVLTDMLPVLKGEDWVIEDDMDVWPYDIALLSEALREGNIEVLRQELRILRGRKDVVGSDLRFPFYAEAAGYTLWGDPDVRPGHNIDYRVTPDDFSAVINAKSQESLEPKTRKHVSDERRENRKLIKELSNG